MPPKSGKRKKFYRHRLLLDEQFPIRTYIPATNSRFNVKHIVYDFGKRGLTDEQLYQFALGEERLIVTMNIKHFRNLIKSSDRTGIIGISGNLRLEQIDKKLSSLLLKNSKRQLFGELTKI